MKQEEILNKFAQKALSYLESAEAFTAKELPLYVKELLEFKFYESAISLGGSVFIAGIMLLAALVLGVICKREARKNLNTRSEEVMAFAGAFAFCFLLFAFIPLVTAKDEVVELIKIKTAPRVYLIDYIKGNK